MSRCVATRCMVFALFILAGCGSADTSPKGTSRSSLQSLANQETVAATAQAAAERVHRQALQAAESSESPSPSESSQ